MEQNHSSYTCSEADSQEAQRIRSKYLAQAETPLETLKKLDTKVKAGANVFAYTYGSMSAIIMGAGMSLVMTEIGTVLGLASTMVPGIVIGAAGMGMALTTYPIYKKILHSRKKKYASEILKLSDSIIHH